MYHKYHRINKRRIFMFGKFSEEAQRVLVDAQKEMSELKHPYIGSEHLLLAILKNNQDLVNKFKKYKITYKSFKEELINLVGIGDNTPDLLLYSTTLKTILENVIIESRETGDEISVNELLLSLLNEGEGKAIRILLSLGVDINKLYSDISEKRKIKQKKSKKLIVEELGVDLTKRAKNNELDPVIGRDIELNRVIEILSRRTKNNPLLIGEAGVGKTAIAEELARRIVSGNVPMPLKNKRIISVDMACTVAGTKYRGEFEERIKKMVKELEDNDDVIIFIDEIHTLVGAGGAEGAIDASNILKPALARGKLKLIGATTISEYKKFIEKDNALDRRFQKVFVEEPDKSNLKNILMNLKSIYEAYHGVKIEEKLIDKIIELSDRYIYDRCEPDKSIDILDEVCTKVSLKEAKEEKEIIKLSDCLTKIQKEKNNAIINQNYDKAYSLKEDEEELQSKINKLKLDYMRKEKVKKVKLKDIVEVVSSKTKIPINEISKDYITSINEIEKTLKENIIGQDEAINKLIDISKKIKLGIKDKNKSYSVLFCGSTGTGKTYLSKLFAENLVGKNNVIKLDMSEYSESISINKIIGSPAGYVGYDDNKNILEEIRNKPYSVLILDEIEKAHKSVLNFFLNILDEGNCKDSSGKTVRFDNVLIIMTSNAYVSKSLMGFNKNTTNNSLEDFFSKEFINRIDEIVPFNKFTEEDINKIIIKEANKCYKKYNNENIISLDMINRIIKESNYEEYGVRKLCKAVRKEIENQIVCNIFS
ncbi:MAG TPA: ATP-dependent Clp protease ATP-binding subunit ClpC [Firmicutes bacterium]|nr:ATP-dependent Clp protease ATP-binding subunit ClpC [Bacillota bacterium]